MNPLTELRFGGGEEIEIETDEREEIGLAVERDDRDRFLMMRVFNHRSWNGVEEMNRLTELRFDGRKKKDDEVKQF